MTDDPRPIGENSWRNLLSFRGIRLRKDLGQHVLHDPQFLRAIAKDAVSAPGTPVLEIGAGVGTLTRALIEEGAVGIAVEIDGNLAEIARGFIGRPSTVDGNRSTVNRQPAKPSFELRSQDFFSSTGHPSSIDPGLERDLVRLSETARRPLTIVSNLPYRTYRGMILALLGSRVPVDRMVLLVQREGADRMRAEPGSRLYDPFPVLVRTAGTVRKLRDAPPSIFWPKPKVRSVLVEWKAEGLDRWRAERTRELEPVLERLFQQRRKTVESLLRRIAGEEAVRFLPPEVLRERLERLPPGVVIEVGRRVASMLGAGHSNRFTTATEKERSSHRDHRDD